MKKISTLLLIFLFITSLIAQKPELKFEKILDNNGLPLGFITDIEQDKNGFIWFTTLQGLYRYDGYEFKIFQNIYNDSTSLPYNSFDDLYIDSEGIIWLICRDGGERSRKNILSFNPKKTKAKIGNIASESIINPSQVIEDGFNNLWIATYGSGIHKYNKASKENKMYCKSYPKYNNRIYSIIDSLTGTENNIAEINQVKDMQKLQKAFSIKEEIPVLIISIGEGEADMFDYGFITCGNDTIWQMKFTNTKNAGGAEKNRIEIKIDTLIPGKYILHYVSDDSHSYEAWNEPKPEVTDFYGIKIYKLNDKTKSQVQPYLISVPEKDKTLSNYIRDILIDDSGKNWILTYFGISEYNYDAVCFIHHEINFKDILKVEDGDEMPRKIFMENNIFWIITNKHLIKYNINEKTYKVYADSILQKDWINSINKNTKGQFLLAGNKYLHIFDNKTETFYHYETKKKNLYRDAQNFFEDKSGTYWISSYEGLNKTKKTKFNYTGLFRYSKHKHLVHTYIDKSDILWHVIPETNYLFSYSNQDNTFNKYILIDENLPELVKNNPNRIDWINFIYEDSNNNLWLAISNGLYMFDREQGKIVNSTLINDSTVTEIKNEIVRIHEDKNKNLWIFSYRGIYQYDYNNNILTKKTEFNLIENSENERKNNIDFIFEDEKKTLWLRTYNGLFSFDTKSNQITKIISFDKEYYREVHRGNIYSDKHNNLWLATYKKLYKINLNNEKLTKYIIRDIHKKIDWDVGYKYYKVVEDNKQTIWISTRYGLVKFNKKTEQFKTFTVDEGLMGNIITEMVIDNNGMFWLATTEGVSKFDPKREIFTNYNETYLLAPDTHLKHQFINRNKLNDGTVLFFTTYGICTFNPDNYNKNVPTVVITKLKLFDKEYFSDSIVHQKKLINLNYKQNFISFEFAALDYTNSKRNRYAYMLEGVDNNWIYTDYKDRKAKYTDLSPGTYLFRVQASNNDGVWNEKGVAITIIITPPFWKTWWFYTLEVIAGLLLIFIFVKYRERKLLKEKDQLENIVEERTQEVRQQSEEIKSQNEELHQQNEEIQSMNESLNNQKDLVEERNTELNAQNEEISTQRDQLSNQNKSINESILYAKRIQTAVLPRQVYIDEILPENFILFMPRDKVSGDFYWVKQISDFIVIAADCTGHGVPGAILSMLGMSFLNEIVQKREITEANQVLNELRKQIKQALRQTGKKGEADDGMDISLCVLETKSKKLQYAGANNPLYLIQNDELTEIKADRMPIGYYPNEKPTFTNHEIQLNDGDIFYLFSDGYIDQFGGKKGFKYKSKNFQNILFENHNKPMIIQKQLLEQELKNWMKGYDQTDDILVMGVRV